MKYPAKVLASVVMLTVCLISDVALAHSFGKVASYKPPLPFEFYLWGAAAALILSFVITAFFVSDGKHRSRKMHQPADQSAQGNTKRHSLKAVEPSVAHTDYRSADSRAIQVNQVSQVRQVRQVNQVNQPQLSAGLSTGLANRWLWPLRIAQVVTLAIFLLCIVAGFWGTEKATQNLNMTAFWIVFVLAFAYCTAIVGNVFSLLSPWRQLAAGLGRLSRRYADGWLPYPQRLGYWPAVLLYVGFIWVELFGETTPFSLSVWLVGYTAFTLVAAGLFGIRAWFTYGEFFAVFFSLLAKMAPVNYEADPVRGKTLQANLRIPFSGLVTRPAGYFSLVVFVLFMLASTAYDGMHETQPWKDIYWKEVVFPWAYHEVFAQNLGATFRELAPLYEYWQVTWLLLFGVLYLAVYMVFISIMKWLGGGTVSIFNLALRFVFSLLPIVLVYHVAHYVELLPTLGVKIIPLLSDPFGWDWDLFGTKMWFYGDLTVSREVIWHLQAGLILFGHIVSVVIAHIEALRVFPNHLRAVLSQLPMLLLMVGFTVFGLWILALPAVKM